ncbi:MAG: hypothetical protein KGL39_49290 [Patescibacteria group bacterium]|nr:hypothetical protein [Patescibacteria group bacterium]
MRQQPIFLYPDEIEALRAHDKLIERKNEIFSMEGRRILEMPRPPEVARV